MDEKELQALIEQLSQQRSGGGGFSSAPRTPHPGGMQVTRGGLSPQEEYIRWAWGPGMGATGGLGPAPLAVQGLLQQTGGRVPQAPGSPMNGIGPAFAQAVNAKLFPNVSPGFDVINTIHPSQNIPGGNAETNQMYADMQAEKANYEAKTPGYKLSPEEEQTIEDAIRRRYMGGR